MASGAPSMSMGANNVGVGNYKGVMLCNRPFGGTAASSKQMAVPDKSTFSCGVIPETIGINIPISTKDKHKFDRPKKDTVITKHRKWLAELQRKKEMLESQYLNEVEEKKDQLEKFTEREAHLRKMANALTRSNVGDENKGEDGSSSPIVVAEDKHGSWGTSGASSSDKAGDKGTTDAKADGKGYNNNIAESKGGAGATQKSVAYASDSKGTTHTGSHIHTNRPAWALTETAAAVASEEKTQGDEDELLDFAASLDFDRYMGDVEVRVMIDGLRKRIVDLEREASQEEGRGVAQEERAAKKEMLTKMIEDAMAMGAQQEEKSDMERNIAAAKALLAEEGSDLHAIHSAKSITAIIKASKDRQQVPTHLAIETSKVYNEPVVVSYDPEEGARLAKNTAVANLPYMHRNPAV